MFIGSGKRIQRVVGINNLIDFAIMLNPFHHFVIYLKYERLIKI